MEDARKPVLARPRSLTMVVSSFDSSQTGNYLGDGYIALPKSSLLNRYLYILCATD